MYLHIGQDYVINEQDILGVFDLDNISSEQASLDFLKNLDKDGRIITISDDLPKSFILTISGGVEIGYLSPISSRAISNRS